MGTYMSSAPVACPVRSCEMEHSVYAVLQVSMSQGAQEFRELTLEDGVPCLVGLGCEDAFFGNCEHFDSSSAA